MCETGLSSPDMHILWKRDECDEMYGRVRNESVRNEMYVMKVYGRGLWESFKRKTMKGN